MARFFDVYKTDKIRLGQKILLSEGESSGILYSIRTPPPTTNGAIDRQLSMNH